MGVPDFQHWKVGVTQENVAEYWSLLILNWHEEFIFSNSKAHLEECWCTVLTTRRLRFILNNKHSTNVFFIFIDVCSTLKRDKEAQGNKPGWWRLKMERGWIKTKRSKEKHSVSLITLREYLFIALPRATEICKKRFHV